MEFTADRVKRPPAVIALLALLLFLGVTGLAGGAALIAAPDGHLIRAPQSWLTDTPFPNLLIPGLALFFVVGALSLVAVAALMRRPDWSLPQGRATVRRDWAWTVTGAAGFGIIMFEIVEAACIGLDWPQLLYMGIGAAIVALDLSRPVRDYYHFA